MIDIFSLNNPDSNLDHKIKHAVGKNFSNEKNVLDL